MSISVVNHNEYVKDELYNLIEAYFDGNSHTLSGASTPFPNCDVRMFLEPLPQSSGTMVKPLISVVPASSGRELGRWVTGVSTDTLPVILRWSKSSVSTIKGYYVYRAATELGTYTKISGLITRLSYIDAPVAGTYWYKIMVVAADDSESLHDGPDSHTVSAGNYPNYTYRQQLFFRIFITTPQSLGGQRVCDQIASLLKALIEGVEGVILRISGLKLPFVSTPFGLRMMNTELYVNELVLRFNIDLEYV